MASHYEYEFTDDGHLQHSTRSIQQARQAYREGNREPYLHLLADPRLTGAQDTIPCILLSTDPDLAGTEVMIPIVRLSPHLQRLQLHVETGRIKRPKGRGKRTEPLTHNEIMEIGMQVRNLIGSTDLKEACNYRDCCPSPYESQHQYTMEYRHAIARVAEGVPALKDWNGEEILDGTYSPPIPLHRVRAAYAAFLKLTGNSRPAKKKPTTTRSSRPTHSTSKP